jgi:hypothetical protein
MDPAAGTWFVMIHRFVVALMILTTPVAADVVINEIMVNPSGDENAREYVELYNTGSKYVGLSWWLIGNMDGMDNIIAPPDSTYPAHIMGGGYAVILDPDYFEGDDLYQIPESAVVLTISSRGFGRYGILNGRPDSLGLYRIGGSEEEVAAYELSMIQEGFSIERIDATVDGSDPRNWSVSHVYGGTPGAPNDAAVALPPSGEIVVSEGIPTSTAQFDVMLAVAPVQMTVTIYDRAGRQVRRLIDGDRRTGRTTVQWDGLDDRERPVTTGRYIVHVEALDLATNNVHRLRATVVIARQK